MLFIGTSGWQYRHFRGVLYPEGLASARWLEHYAALFRIVEVNNTFYRLPEAHVFSGWAERTPPDFTFALKMSRFLTHLRRLREPEEPIQRFLERSSALGPKRGPLLLQLPTRMKPDAGRLDAALALLVPHVRVAVEFREEAWNTQAVFSLLKRHGAALCAWDRAGERAPLQRTADFGYVRFHEGTARGGPRYDPRALSAWARRIAETFPAHCDVHVFFNNDAEGAAVRDAIAFARAADRVGLPRTRVPNRAG